MFTFKDYLSESVLLIEAKSVHLVHVEDEILESGYNGAKQAIAYLEGVAGMLAGHSDSSVMVTTKWDGNPAIFAGTNPENGKFFVGTKGIFSKSNPRICYTKQDVDKFYGEVPELANKLHAALKYLPKLGIKDYILQGDVMFGPGETEQRNIDGQKYITFFPNTIMYAVPEDSELGKRVARAKFGIIFHTAYKGTNIHELKGTFRISLDNLGQSNDVWYDDASYLDASGSVTMTAQETAEVANHLNTAKRILGTISKEDFNKIFSNKTFIQMLKQHQNALIRGGEQIGDPRQWLEKLTPFLQQKVGKEKTSPEAQQRKMGRLQAHTQDLQEALMKVLEFQKHIVATKQTLLQKLETAKRIGTFHVTDDGIKVAKQEGFVAVDHAGKAVKLVDRLEFSRQNWARRTSKENEESNSFTATQGGSILKQGNPLGGDLGLAGKNPDDTAILGKPSGTFVDSTGSLGAG